MIDNFEQIKKILDFSSEDTFYFVQILQRKKDNPGNINGSNNSSRLIKAYYIHSIAHLEKNKEEIIFFANHFNARVGINLNQRSYYKTAFNTLQIVANQMLNKNFKGIPRAWNRACGVYYIDQNDTTKEECDEGGMVSDEGSKQYKKQAGDKIWLLDVDNITDVDILNMFDYPESRREFALREFLREQQPKGDKVIAKIPSKSGYHLMVKGFDSREFKRQWPDIEIHKNNPTNLYIP